MPMRPEFSSAPFYMDVAIHLRPSQSWNGLSFLRGYEIEFA